MKTVVIFSGGMDSTTLLYYLLDKHDEVKALSIDYGQRHVRELEAAKTIAKKLDIEHRIADLRSLLPFLKGSSQTDTVPVPEGHYADESMRVTVVPNRNAIMLSVAAAWAISSKFDSISYAVHEGDHAVYPDCRWPFIESMRDVLRVCDYAPLSLRVPFANMTKAAICREGAKLGVPYELTYSCYKGGEVHCGRCGTDVERILSFHEAGVVDPTSYVDKSYALSLKE